jgi:hypothetical protein
VELQHEVRRRHHTYEQSGSTGAHALITWTERYVQHVRTCVPSYHIAHTKIMDNGTFPGDVLDPIRHMVHFQCAEITLRASMLQKLRLSP